MVRFAVFMICAVCHAASNEVRMPGAPASNTVMAPMGDGIPEIAAGSNAIPYAVTGTNAAAASLQSNTSMGDIAHALTAVKGYDWRELIINVIFALIATGVLAGILIVMKKLFPKLYRTLTSMRDGIIPSIKLQKLELLSSSRIVAFLVKAAKGMRIALTIVLFYFYIPLMFSFFPVTRGLAAVLFGYILSPLGTVWHGFVAYLPNVFFIGVIGVVTYYVTRLIGWLFVEIGKGTIVLPGFYRDWARTTFLIVRFFIFAVAGVMIFPYLPGAGSPAFQGVGVFLGLLLSLGSASAISNIIAGVVLTYTRAFSIGDRVKIADTVGDVAEKSLLVTRVRTIKNVIITIPNAIVLANHVVNFSAASDAHPLILHTSVTIGYDAPWPKVQSLLIAAAREVNDIMGEPPPFVLQTALDDFTVRYELNVYTKNPHRSVGIISELHERIQDGFHAAGVEIMSPHFTAIRDGNHAAIPSDHLPASYTAPTFRVSAAAGKGEASHPDGAGKGHG